MSDVIGGVLLASEDPRDWLPNAYLQADCYDSDKSWLENVNSS